MIDCQTRRLVDAPPQCQYVALSYVSDQDTMNFGNIYIHDYMHQKKISSFRKLRMIVSASQINSAFATGIFG
jgi:hypothetical protein